MADECARCAERGMFGYRDKETGAMVWYCAAHRLGQWRGKSVSTTSSDWEGWKGR
jgi:hypothetical protein